MTVKRLINILQKCNQRAKVFCAPATEYNDTAGRYEVIDTDKRKECISIGYDAGGLDIGYRIGKKPKWLR